jgi:hypothetical protein
MRLCCVALRSLALCLRCVGVAAFASLLRRCRYCASIEFSIVQRVCCAVNSTAIVLRLRCVYAASTLRLRCVYAASTLRLRCVCAASTLRLRCVYAASTLRLPRDCAASTLRLRCVCAASTLRLRCVYAVCVTFALRLRLRMRCVRPRLFCALFASLLC